MAAGFKNMIKDTSIYGVCNILRKGIGFLLLPLYTRFLSPSDYGLLEIIEVTAVIIEFFAGVGITYAVFKFYHKCDSEQERALVISTAVTTVICVNCLFAIIGIGFSKFFSVIILKDATYQIYIMLIFFRLTVVGSIMIGLDYMRLIKRPYLYGLLSLLRLLSAVVLNIFFLVVLKTGVKGILLSSIISAFLVGLPVIVYLYWQFGFHFSFSKMWGMIKFGIPLVFALIGQLIINSADRFVLQRLTSLADVGIYSLGYKFGFLVNFLVVVAFALMWEGKMFEVEKRPDAREVYSRVLTYYVLSLVSVALVLILFIDNILVVMTTPPFHAAKVVVPYIAIAYIFNGLQEYFRLGMLINGKTSVVGVVVLIQCIVSVGLYYILGRYLGVQGVAVAVAVSYFNILVANYILSQRLYRIPIDVKRILKILMAFAAAMLFKFLIPYHSFISSVFINVGLFLLFPIILLLLGFVSENERNAIKTLPVFYNSKLFSR